LQKSNVKKCKEYSEKKSSAFKLNYANIELEVHNKQKFQVNLNGNLEIAGALSGHRQERDH